MGHAYRIFTSWGADSRGRRFKIFNTEGIDFIDFVNNKSKNQRFRKNRCDVILGFALNIQGKSFPRPAIVG